MEKRTRSYAIVGVGGVGGYYGGRLALAGFDVRFLLHSDYEYVREHGLKVRSCNGDFCLPKVKAYNDALEIGVVDVVIVSLKTTREHLLKELLPPLIGKDTVVVLLQNGLGMETDVERMLPGTKIAAGAAFICSEKTGPGEVWHQHFGSVNIAAFNTWESEVGPIVLDFLEAKVDARLMEYHEARWKKALWNIPFNGLSVAMGMRTDELARGCAAKVCRAVMEEVKELSRVVGVRGRGNEWIIGDKECDRMMEMTEKMPPYSPSMKVDFDNGRELELEYLYRKVVWMAGMAGYKMEKTEMLLMELEALTDRRDRKRGE